MKILFIDSRYKSQVSLKSLKSNLKKLPNKIAIVATIQFTDQLKKIKSFLEKHNKKVFIARSKKLGQGQILGCDVSAAITLQNKVQAFLYIGSGKFHPIAIALSLKKLKPIFIFNPLTEEFSKLDEKEISKYKKRKQGQKIKFMTAKKLGILVSIKPGQENLKQALALKNKLEKQGKDCCIFLFDNFDINQLENWPEIECWINTACPGLSLENPLAWINDIKK